MRFLTYLGSQRRCCGSGFCGLSPRTHATSLPLPNARTDPALGSEGTNKKIRSNVAELNRKQQ